jgi:hypothetical protein
MVGMEFLFGQLWWWHANTHLYESSSVRRRGTLLRLLKSKL